MENMPYFFIVLLLIASGPVKHLQCSYDVLRQLPLLCTWDEPELIYAPIQSYHVNLIHNGTIKYQKAINALKMETNHNLKPEEIYTVSVRAVNHEEGEIAITRVNFVISGILIFR